MESIKQENGGEYKPLSIEVSGSWAIIEATFVDRNGTPTVDEGTIYIAHLVNGEWTVAKPGTDLYLSWIDQIPDTLLSDELKNYIR